MVSPNLEGLKDCQKLLVMGVIVEFRIVEGTRVIGDGVNLSVRKHDRVDCGDGIVRRVRLDQLREVRKPMGQDRCRGECQFQCIESGFAGLVEMPRGILPKEACEGHHDIRVACNESTIEICKPKE